jgi:hypothetical protein
VSVLEQPLLRRLGRRLGIRRAAGMLGYEMVKKHFYSPIPDLERLPDKIWTSKSDLSGIRFDIDAGLSFLQRELGPYISEYRPPLTSTGDPRQVYLENTFYEGLDTETLYAMVRRFKPSRIIELGSGISTLVMADARARDGALQAHRHDVFDPYPRADLAPVLEQVADVHRISATDVPLRTFAELQAGDFLFVDTTHTVKIGGDVNRVILDVLPALAPGVMVHFHDIFLPFEYPREFLVERRFFWTEQYLLQAFLAFNDEFDVLFGTHALKREYPEIICDLVPSAARSQRPAALWLRRVEPSAR